MIVYLICNKINGKCYVGQTIMTLRERWNCHLSAARTTSEPTYLQRAIRKYGAGEFVLDVLARATSLADLNELEQRFIQQFEAQNPKKGYNIQAGGREGDIGGGRPIGIPVTVKTREKLRSAHLGKIHSSDHVGRVREARLGDKNPQFGCKWMNRGGVEKLVPKTDQISSLEDGWHFGRPSAVSKAKAMRSCLIWNSEMRFEAAYRAKNQSQSRGEGGRFVCS